MHACKDCQHWGRNHQDAIPGEGGISGRVTYAPCMSPRSPVHGEFRTPCAPACKQAFEQVKEQR
jgi:hypothetical protein